MNKFYRYLSKAPAPAAGAGPTLSRRGLLMVATGGGLTLALLPADALIADTADAPEKEAFQPTIWYEIRDDGRILVNIAEAEMGQHVGTALARIVADELEADWSQVELHHVDSDPKWGLMVTGGSWSVWQNFMPLSQAGAAGRMVLVEAGAELLGVSPQNCQARDSRVIAGDRSIGYAEIVSRTNINRSFSDEELADMPVKPATERRLIGKQTSALDVPAKTNGEGRYGIDAEIDGMVFGRPLIPPTRYGSSIRSIDDSAAQLVPGYRQTLILEDPSGTVPGWGMVIGDSFHAANSAAALVEVDWSPGETAEVTEQDLLDRGRELIGDATKGALWWMTKVWMPHSSAQMPCSSRTTRPAACCISSWNRSTRWPSRKTAGGRFIPVTSGNLWPCPRSPKRSARRKPTSSCALT